MWTARAPPGKMARASSTASFFSSSARTKRPAGFRSSPVLKYAPYWDRVKTPLWRQTRAIHSASLELYDSYQRQIGTCDGEIESLLQDLAAKHALPGTALPPARRRQRHKNAPRFEIRSPLHQLSGVDLTQIDAIGPYTALRLIAEIGTDMTRWPSEKHFTSWLTLAPKNKITGGRLISSRTMPSANRAAAMLRMCAMSAGKTSTALGAFYRRLAYRIGKAKAITATARKLAILVYRVLRGDIDYADPGVEAYEAQHRSRTLRNLRNRVQRLGLGLIDLETGELMDPGVS